MAEAEVEVVVVDMAAAAVEAAAVDMEEAEEVVVAEEAAEMAAVVDTIKIIDLPVGRQVLANILKSFPTLERIFYYWLNHIYICKNFKHNG